MAFIVPFIPLLVGAGSSAVGVYGAKSASGSNKRSLAAEQSAIDKQLAFEREKEAERKAEYEREQEEAKLQWDAQQKQADEDRAFTRSTYTDSLAQRQAEFAFEQQKYVARQAQMAPYRAAGTGALAQLAQLAGVDAPSAAAAPLLETMPEHWQSGDPVTAASSGRAGDRDARSLLDNPNLLPTTLTAAGTRDVTDVPMVPLPVTLSDGTPAPSASGVPASSFRDVSTQLLASAAPSATPAFTPAQIEILLRRDAGPSLRDLIRTRRVQV